MHAQLHRASPLAGAYRENEGPDSSAYGASKFQFQRQTAATPSIRWSQAIGALTMAIALILAAAMQAYATPQQQSNRRCTGFVDLTLGDIYHVGDSFTSAAFTFEVEGFYFDSGTLTTGGFVEVESGGRAGGSGNELEINNTTIALTLPITVAGLSLEFGEYGGNVNIAVNNDARNTANFSDLDGSVIGGANVFVTGGTGNGLGHLLLRGAITSLRIGGQEFYLDNLCTYDRLRDDNPDPDADPASRPDVGDAPDSTNHHANLANTAYPGPVPGRFPTVHLDPNGAPFGPLHRNMTLQGILGNRISAEREADIGPDGDGINNILDGGLDNANQDLFDDGWRNPSAPFQHCQPTTLVVRVRRPAGATLDKMYLNVWRDGNSDGDWKDAVLCQIPGQDLTDRAFEWIVQDFSVDMNAIPVGGFVDISINTRRVLDLTPDQPHWMRFTLSERPAPKPVTPSNGLPDGRAPQEATDQPDTHRPVAYTFGETEDHIQRPFGQDGAPGDLVIEKVAGATAGTLQPGDVFTYSVVLQHDGGIGHATVVLSDSIPAELSFAGRPHISEETPHVAPLSLLVSGRTVLWRGLMSPNAMLRINIPVRVNRCYGDTPREVVNTAVARSLGGETVRASTAVSVQCADLDIASGIVITRHLEIRTDEGASDDTNSMTAASLSMDDRTYELLPNQKARIQFHVTNHNPVPVILGISLNFLKIEYEVLATDSRILGHHDTLRVIVLEPGESTSLYSDESSLAGLLAILQDHVTSEQLLIAEEPGVEISFLIKLLPYENQIDVWEHASALQILVPSIRIRQITRDLGDAPDSSTHFPAVAMTAYSIPPTQANYPTVHNPSLGVSGPEHRHPRPFHLGRSVSWEAEADIGPDVDFINNIEPALDQANLDRFDDGANPPVWTLSHCRRTRVPVEVLITPQAVSHFQQRDDKNGYLNIWLDGNRDGDWEDSFTCATPDEVLDDNQNADPVTIALEHVVIDFPVDVTALGPGLHTIMVQTGRVPWPADRINLSAWIRVTLSERPANKTLSAAGILYGDGRGYDLPFTTGETEDYHWRPADQPGGVDVTIHKRGRLRQEFDEEEGIVKSVIAWTIDYYNRGNRPAPNVVIRDRLEGDQDIRAILHRISKNPDVPHEIDDGDKALVFRVGTLEPQAGGRIVIITNVTQHITQLNRLTNVAHISADGDVDESNNTARASVAVGVTPPRILYPGDGTVCENEVMASGISLPNAEITLYADGTEVATTTATEDGHWSTTIHLDDGRHMLYATATVAGVTSPPSVENLVIVDSLLAWSPASVRFVSEHGRVRRPIDDSGRTDIDGWQLNLRPRTTYSVHVDLCCDSENAIVTLNMEGFDEPVVLTDPDNDNTYSAQFQTGPRNPNPGPITLTVICGDLESQGSGEVVLIDPEGQVYDVTQPNTLIEGATVACMEQQTASNQNGTDSTFTLWNAAAYGQTNPQATAADGYFSFLTPAGVYRLEVSRDGYQPYTSPDLAVVSDPVRYDVGLTPVIDQAADHTILIGPSGFEPSYLEIEPGDVLEWVNADLDAHSSTLFRAQIQAAGVVAIDEVLWDSGLLGPGESYKFRIGSQDTYTYVDRADDSNSGVVVVQDPEGPVEEEDEVIFLPAVAND